MKAMLSRQDDAFFPRWYLCTIEQRELLSLQSQISGKLFVVIQLLLEDRCQWLPRAVRTKPHPYSTTKIRPSTSTFEKIPSIFKGIFNLFFQKKACLYRLYLQFHQNSHWCKNPFFIQEFPWFWHFKNVNFEIIEISDWWILWKLRFWKREFLWKLRF